MHVKMSARTRTAAPHYRSHCHQLRVYFLTLQFLLTTQASFRSAMSSIPGDGSAPDSKRRTGSGCPGACSVSTKCYLPNVLVEDWILPRLRRASNLVVSTRILGRRTAPFHLSLFMTASRMVLPKILVLRLWDGPMPVSPRRSR